MASSTSAGATSLPSASPPSASASSRSASPATPPTPARPLLGKSSRYTTRSRRRVTLITSGILRWLHEAALTVGIKANRDSLSLSFELDHGEMLSLAAHVDRDDKICCISWWLFLEDGLLEEKKIGADAPEGWSSRRFLGYFSLNVLYTTLMDLVSLGNGTIAH